MFFRRACIMLHVSSVASWSSLFIAFWGQIRLTYPSSDGHTCKWSTKAQINGQLEQFNITIWSTLRRYMWYHQKNWDLYTPVLKFSYNRQPHISTSIATFDLIISHAIHTFLTADSFPTPKSYPNPVLFVWNKLLEDQISTAIIQLTKSQAWYKTIYDRKHGPRGKFWLLKDMCFYAAESHKPVNTASPFCLFFSESHPIFLTIWRQLYMIKTQISYTLRSAENVEVQRCNHNI